MKCSSHTLTPNHTIKQRMMFALLIAAVVTQTHAFVNVANQHPHAPPTPKPTRTSLFGIAEWRDLPLDESLQYDGVADSLIRRRLPIHMVDSKDVVLPGQEMHFHWNEDEEVRLYQQIVDVHQGMFAVGLTKYDAETDQTGVLDTMPLLEIQQQSLMGGELGVFCRARVVGRVRLESFVLDDENGNAVTFEGMDNLELNGMPLGAIVAELEDGDVQEKDLVDANHLCASIMHLLHDTNAIEQNMSNADDDNDEWMSINFAPLCDEVTRPAGQVEFVATPRDSKSGDATRDMNDDDGECSSPDDQANSHSTRWQRFQEAFDEALLADNIGYHISAEQARQCESEDEHLYSWKELSALSWAAFSTSSALHIDSVYREHALGMDCVVNRLKLANFWLTDVRDDVARSMEQN